MMKWMKMYRDFFASLSFKKTLFLAFVIKLLILWALFHYLYTNPYTNAPANAPSAIAEKLKPQ